MTDILTPEQVVAYAAHARRDGILIGDYALALCDTVETLRAELDAMTEDRDKYRDAINAEMRLRQDYGTPTIESAESLDKGSPRHRVDNNR